MGCILHRLVYVVSQMEFSILEVWNIINITKTRVFK